MAYRAPSPSVTILVVGYANQVFGLDPVTGRRIWRYVAEDNSPQNPVRVIVLGERVYALMDFTLHLLEYSSGRLLARTKSPHATGSTFMLAEGRLFAAGNGAIVCFGLDGELLWADPLDDKDVGTVSIGVPGYSVQGDLR